MCSSDLPLDAQVVWIDFGTNVPTILGPDGLKVPVTVTTIQSPGYATYQTLVPDEPLLPGTTYQVQGAAVTKSFTTGDRLAEPPTDTEPTVTVEVDDGKECLDDGTTLWEEDAEHVWVILLGSIPAGSHLEAEVFGPDWEGTVVGEEGVMLSWGGRRR